jgi:hypothetical protein
MITICQNGAMLMLRKFFNNTGAAAGTYSNDLWLKLFVNTPFDPSTTSRHTKDFNGTTISSSFTEPVLTGYAAIRLDATLWNAPTLINGIPTVTYPQQMYTFTGALGDTIYGYFIHDNDNILVFAEKHTSPFTPTSAGDKFLVTPAFSLGYGIPVA